MEKIVSKKWGSQTADYRLKLDSLMAKRMALVIAAEAGATKYQY